ncbi:hypothetical protein V8G54_010142 [Vigna mungo]|uniref:NAC domain-containing protein n=1 Tax=Vigna mungo TaxID=3915 RepID=A0AAQ3NVV4_VIGMU
MQLVESPSFKFPLVELPTDVEPKLALLLNTYQYVFEMPSFLPPNWSHDDSIPLIEGSQPVKVKPYRYLHSMLEEGIIQPTKSPFFSPIIFVKKKDGSLIVCTNYRALNVVTMKDIFPIPTVDELFRPQEARVLFIESRSSSLQVGKEKLAFPFSKVGAVPFELAKCSLPVRLSKEAPFRFDHLNNLEYVLKTLQHQKLYARLSTCSFGVKQIDYLGHVLSRAGMAMETKKLAAIDSWPQSTSIKQLRGFLGLTSYYRIFIKHYVSMVGPLTDLLKKNSFQWSALAAQAFLQLKQAMTSTPVLALPNFKEPLILETDVSRSGIKAILSQEQHLLLGLKMKVLDSRLRKKIEEKKSQETALRGKPPGGGAIRGKPLSGISMCVPHYSWCHCLRTARGATVRSLCRPSLFVSLFSIAGFCSRKAELFLLSPSYVTHVFPILEKDVVLARVLDDATIANLNSIVHADNSLESKKNMHDIAISLVDISTLGGIAYYLFHPTDEKLVAYYLKRKINSRKMELETIPEVDLDKCEP